MEANLVSKKRRGEENLVSLSSSSSGKIVLTLVIEVIALHVGLFVVYVRGTRLQRFILRFFVSGGSLSF